MFSLLGLRSGGHHNGNTGTRPSAPFRSNVYQPTEMTMILNGGAVSASFFYLMQKENVRHLLADYFSLFRSSRYVKTDI